MLIFSIDRKSMLYSFKERRKIHATPSSALLLSIPEIHVCAMVSNSFKFSL
jgi:hypothetical protein